MARSLPHRVERPDAVGDRFQFFGLVRLNPAAGVVEEVELDKAAIDEPEVVLREVDVRRTASGQPANLLASGNVGESEGVLVPDVLARGLRDHPHALGLHAIRGHFLYEVEPWTQPQRTVRRIESATLLRRLEAGRLLPGRRCYSRSATSCVS